MTTTYDPYHAQYLDEADLRGELTRVFDTCNECRLCVSMCETFPTLIEMIAQRGGDDAGRLTPAQQNRIVETCHHCKLCAVSCPYAPDKHAFSLDFPKLMLRARAMVAGTGQESVRSRITTQIVARTDIIGRVAVAVAPAANSLLSGSASGSGGGVKRTLVQWFTGMSRQRELPLFAAQRFSQWFRRRPKVRMERRQGRVALFPTCIVEYQQPAIGHDLVKVYERNGVEVALADVGCCGLPWLYNGDVERFAAVARKNVAVLAREVAKGNDIVVPQPGCGLAIKRDYPVYAPGPDVHAVAGHTFDAAEYLMRLHRSESFALDTAFDGDVPSTITYHVPSHLRAQNVGLRSRDLLKLTGASIRLVQQPSGVDAMLGYRTENALRSRRVSAQLGLEVSRANSEIVSGDCHLANTAIREQTGTVPMHPIQVIARAYGIRVEDLND